METATIATATGIAMGTGIATAIATETEIVTATAATAMAAAERGTAVGEKERAGKGQARTEEVRTALLFQIHQNGRRAGGTVRAELTEDTE